MPPNRPAFPTPARPAGAIGARPLAGRGGTPTRNAAIPSATSPRPRIDLSEVLAALSRALDLTEGQPQGHSARSAVIGMRLATEMGLAAADRAALYFAILLKDAGCSSNAARMSAIFGADDRTIKPRMKLVDWHQRGRLALETWRSVGSTGEFGGGLLRSKIRHFAAIARTPGITRDLIQVRCDRGAAIVLGLGFPQLTADAVRSLDEHWGGGGYPDGKRGTEIPLFARIASLAQCLETVHASHGVDEALRVVRKRRGSWFDPILVDRVLGWRGDRAWWDALAATAPADVRLDGATGGTAVAVDASRLDDVARAFAEIIDAKSPFTYRHSTNVAEYAVSIARELGMTADATALLYRAALLHDVGKLGVSNRVLDKPAKLTDEERRDVERHPAYTWDILSSVTAFHPFAWTAATHHEKLDGSGYPWGLTAHQLDQPARILAVADMYEALTADRPYRVGMTPADALAILRRESGTKLDAGAIDGLAAVLSRGGAGRATA
ncbi:MAG TPA: HD domain-containing phosphohydrolase [Gemmatimonadaceae bacterium]|nr:HD domain-containing phosphohydrolase [Gemmatimonadaceae bacterium]